MGVTVSGIVVDKPFGVGDIGCRTIAGIIKGLDEKKAVVKAPAAVSVSGADNEGVDAGSQACCVDACGEAGDIRAG